VSHLDYFIKKEPAQPFFSSITSKNWALDSHIALSFVFRTAAAVV